MNAKLSTLLLAGTAAIGIGFAGGAANATSFTGVCPNVLGHSNADGGGTGSVTGCTIGISINSTSIVVNTGTKPNGDTGLVTNTTGTGAALAYESVEDVLVGIVNTGTGTLGSVTLKGAGIFNFDNDGIDWYANIATNSRDLNTCVGGVTTKTSSCYGGPKSFFGNGTSPITNVNTNIVSFIGGLGPGQSTFFSLELPTSGGICTNPADCPHTHFAPEPASMGLLGGALVGLAGFFGLRRRRTG